MGPLAGASLGLGIVGSVIGGAKQKKAARRANKNAQAVQDELMRKAATFGPGDLSADATGRSWMKQFDRQAQGYLSADPRQRFERGQGLAARQLMGQARGLLNQKQRGPSVARKLLRRGMMDAQQGVASGLASQRGLAPAMAAKLGAEQRANIMSDTMNQMAVMRAQEGRDDMQRELQRQQMAAQMRQQAAGIRAGMDAARRSQTAMDREMAMGLMGMGQQRTAAEEAARNQARMIQMNTIEGQNAIDQMLTGQQMAAGQQWSNVGGSLMGLGMQGMAGGFGGGLSQAMQPGQPVNFGNTQLTGNTMSGQLQAPGELGLPQSEPAYGGFGLSAEQAGPQPGVYNPGELSIGEF